MPDPTTDAPFRRVPYAPDHVRSAGRPRSNCRQVLPVAEVYSVTLSYAPLEDRLLVGYSVGDPVIPEAWVVAEEDPINGLSLDPRAPVGCLLQDVPVARKFLNPLRRGGAEARAVEAVDRFLGMLRELDDLL